jgi:transposase
MAQYSSDETKKEIIRKIREDTMSVRDVSIDSGVSTKSIYRWLRDGVSEGNQSLVLENRKLKKEVEQLYGMLGKATAMM